jgi:competence protein ComFC
MLRSWSIFEGPVRSAVLNLKYHRNAALGEVLAQPLAEYVRTLDWQVDLVIPVPLGKERARERGYNQIGIVAKPVAAIRHWQYAPSGLTRTRETRSQVGLTAVERKANVLGAFMAEKEIVSGKRVLLMDDVATTGATISECASALLQANTKIVYALTLARALPHHGTNII